VIRLLKGAVKWVLRNFGLVIFKRSTGIYIGEDETPELVLRLCATVAPMVVDGGAHRGAFVEAIHKNCSNAQFLCFEPDPVLASELRRRFSHDTAVQVVEAALGASCGRAVFNINRSRATNSLAVDTGGTTGLLSELMTTVERIEVDVTTLDEALRKFSVPICDVLKLDLQGNDLPALEGAEIALRSAKVVVVEVWFAPVYTRTPTYAGIYSFLCARGFEMYSLSGLHYSTSDRLLWGDAIFLRKDSPYLSKLVTIA